MNTNDELTCECGGRIVMRGSRNGQIMWESCEECGKES